MEKIKIGITIGDINGIGLEVILKTVCDKRILTRCTPIIYGSSKVVSYHKNIVQLDFQFHPIRSAEQAEHDKINVVNCWTENVNITLGKYSEFSGRYAQIALEQAVAELKMGYIDALVTAPINKKAMQLAGFQFPGHTEYLTEALGSTESVMMMIADNLRIGLITNHLPLAKVAEQITIERVLTKIKIMSETLRIDFGIEKPTIAVLGLNPHAGDDDALGMEESEIIRPAIVAAKEAGILAMGPFPADGFFGASSYRKYDGILAMYHDQGLIPFKTLSFGNGVNYTAGLAAVRTSPDHGTAYDIAGKNMAEPDSFRTALYLAADIARHRDEYTEAHADPLNRNRKKVLKVEEGDYIE
jgi:4-hydroxythreonine-4-phosphate dehydrogenase